MKETSQSSVYAIDISEHKKQIAETLKSIDAGSQAANPDGFILSITAVELTEAGYTPVQVEDFFLKASLSLARATIGVVPLIDESGARMTADEQISTYVGNAIAKIVDTPEQHARLLESAQVIRESNPEAATRAHNLLFAFTVYTMKQHGCATGAIQSVLEKGLAGLNAKFVGLKPL